LDFRRNLQALLKLMYDAMHGYVLAQTEFVVCDLSHVARDEVVFDHQFHTAWLMDAHRVSAFQAMPIFSTIATDSMRRLVVSGLRLDGSLSNSRVFDEDEELSADVSWMKQSFIAMLRKDLYKCDHAKSLFVGAVLSFYFFRSVPDVCVTQGTWSCARSGAARGTCTTR